MGSYRIRRLRIPQNIIDVLEKNNLFSCKDVLTLTKLEFQTILGINRSKAEEILNEVAAKCVSQPNTAYDMYLKQKSLSSSGFLPLSLHSLDLLLQGGLPFGCITEFAGPPGVGKTQFCFMLSILSVLPSSAGGLSSKVIYIDTESAFSADRIKTMAQKKFPHLYKDDQNLANLLQSIMVYKASCIDALKEIIPNLEREVIRNKVKVIIIDSIASLVRKEFGGEQLGSLIQRNNILMEQAALLKNLAQAYDIVIFLTNQITSHIAELESVAMDIAEEDENISSAYVGVPPPVCSEKKVKLHGGNADHVVPALGNTWSHCVNTRLVAQFLDSSVRQLIIAKSPVAPNAAVRFFINESGIVLTGDDIEFINMSDPLNRTIQTKYNFLTSEVTGTGTVFTASATSRQ
uniref:DNA repair protein RAD51-like protein n=1 Tax=Parasteatoda tepidariorum TaxID=114398 RepID=A0A2L2YLV0_PARTP